LRTTAAHSTLCLNDTNSTAILPGGQLGKGVTEVALDRRDIDQATRIEASHDGYAKNFGHNHSRLLILRSDGMELRGEDTLLPQEKPRTDVVAHVRFHLGPDIEITPSDQPQTALLRMVDGSNWAFTASDGNLSVDESLWVDQNGRPHPTQQLVIAADTGKGERHVSWQLRHLG
jgi:uncharacterized heparinase superfamily protein